MLEIEAKIKVRDLAVLRSRLNEAGAAFQERVSERDSYFNAPHRDFGRTDEALRIRYTLDRCTLTYKGAKLRGYGMKAREELSTGIESGEVFEEILLRLGFMKAAEVRKTREYYLLGSASITLDQVEGLGEFVEIELCTMDEGREMPQKIEEIVSGLGIEGELTRTSYLELLLQAKRKEA